MAETRICLLAAFTPVVYYQVKSPQEGLMKSIIDFQNTLRAIQDNSGVSQSIKDIQRRDAEMRAILTPIEELRRAGIVFDSASRWGRDIEQARQLITDYTRFRLPEMTEAARLIAEFRKNPMSQFLATYAEQNADLQRAIETMRTPWLDTQNAIRSMAALTELHGIGHLLSSLPGFSDSLTTALRPNLGDWRDAITWHPEIFTDLAARADFYTSLGFNRALTDFPAPAFEQSLDIAGLRQEPLLLHGSPPLHSDDEDTEEESLARTNMAHKRLFRLETQLRAFIDQQMTQAFGADWPKRRLPNGLYDQWLEKKRKAEQAGREEQPLIAYADFTDYEQVICKRDNWREIFAAFFDRPESVRESFQRLHPIRLDTMHARPITQDDELLLYVETGRLVKVILRLN
jgi:hypothetical protein